MFGFDTTDLQSALDAMDDWTPEKKVGVFIEGMSLNSDDLVTFRNAAETREFVARHEEALWRIKSNLEFVLTSIQIERDAAHAGKPSHLRVIQ